MSVPQDKPGVSNMRPTSRMRPEALYYVASVDILENLK